MSKLPKKSKLNIQKEETFTIPDIEEMENIKIPSIEKRNDNLHDFDTITTDIDMDILIAEEIEKLDMDISKDMEEYKKNSLLSSSFAEQFKTIIKDIISDTKNQTKDQYNSNSIAEPVTIFRYYQFHNLSGKENLQELEIDELITKISENKSGHEELIGAVKPYYDSEVYYSTEKERRNAYDKFISSRYQAVRNYYGDDAIIHAFDASGKTIKNNIPKYKNSIHLIVCNVGYYAYGQLVPRIDIDMFDQAVYAKKGSRHLFRLPYTKSSDKCNRVLRRIINIDTDPEISQEDVEDIDEKLFAQFLVSNVTGEKFNYVQEAITNTDHIIVEKSKNPLPEKAFIELVNLCYKPDLEWNDWAELVWICVHEGQKSNYDYEKIIHEFSKTSSKYNKAETETVIRGARRLDTGKAIKSIGTLIFRAKERNYHGYCEWIKQYRTKSVISKEDSYVFQDFRDYYRTHIFASEKEMLKSFKRDVNRVMACITAGKGSYIKKDNCTDKMFTVINRVKDEVINFDIRYRISENDFSNYNQLETEITMKETEVSELEKKKNEANKVATKTKQLEIKKDIKKLKNELDTIRGSIGNVVSTPLSKLLIGNVNEYINIVCDPDEPKDTKNFNTWPGYKAKLLPEYDKKIIASMLDFIKSVWCNDKEDIYKYFMDWLSFMCQNPGKKSKMACVAVSEQGTGKGTFFQFLTNFIFGPDLTIELSSVNEVTGTFNAHIASRKLISLDDIATTRDEFKSMWCKMKNLITEDTYMHREMRTSAVQQKNFMEFLIFTNHIDSIVIEGSDRRYFVLEISNKVQQNNAWFSKFRKETFNQTVGDHFYTFLMKRDCPDYIDKPPMTEAKQIMQEISKSTTSKFLSELLDQLDIENDDRADLFQSIDGTKMQASELYKKYNQWCQENGERNIATNTKFGIEISKKFNKKKSKGLLYYSI